MCSIFNYFHMNIIRKENVDAIVNYIKMHGFTYIRLKICNYKKNRNLDISLYWFIASYLY